MKLPTGSVTITIITITITVKITGILGDTYMYPMSLYISRPKNPG